VKMEVPENLMHKYLHRRVEDLSVCRQLLLERKFKQIEEIGHQLKGNGATFGFPEVTAIGKSLELSAAKSNSGEVAQALEEFSQWISNLN
jgi:HPt (histidine-containing phosphotransfer) domain-containing protein